MPRANRSYIPGHVWHLTHRCHKREFLLKFDIDRQCWMRWLFEAKKRYGLRILNYIVTSNHIHLLVMDVGDYTIARSMQLVAAQTAQRYNKRTGRKGAFWEDRYHATAVQTDAHLHRCLVYIDLNMVRAGVVPHPGGWRYSGYREIQSPRARYSLIDLPLLGKLCGFGSVLNLQTAHREWVDTALAVGCGDREPRWTRTPAVGTAQFVASIESEIRLAGRSGSSNCVRESAPSYSAGIMLEITTLSGGCPLLELALSS